jgi:hypothetical protein
MSRERLTTKLAALSDDPKKKKQTRERDREHKGELSRNLDGFEYDTSKATVLKKALHNVNVSLGTLLSAMKDLSLLRGSEITPDGMLGGRGFIMPFKEMKSKINSAVNDLSDITDTIADELTNPKWGLSPAEKKKVKDEKDEIKDEIEEIEETVPDAAGTPPTGENPEETEEEPPVDMPPENPEEINPMDVMNSPDVDAVKRYSSYIEGNVKDKVASVLSKNIMANLTKGVTHGSDR